MKSKQDLRLLKKNILELFSKNKFNKTDKIKLDSIMKKIKNKYTIVIVKNTDKTIHPILKKKIKIYINVNTKKYRK